MHNVLTKIWFDWCNCPDCYESKLGNYYRMYSVFKHTQTIYVITWDILWNLLFHTIYVIVVVHYTWLKCVKLSTKHPVNAVYNTKGRTSSLFLNGKRRWERNKWNYGVVLAFQITLLQSKLESKWYLWGHIRNNSSAYRIWVELQNYFAVARVCESLTAGWTRLYGQWWSMELTWPWRTY